MFEQAIPFLKPDLVILDGVRDLISDINDGKEAQRITEQLMTLAQNNNCCIVGVLHQNKSDSDRNLRGWIGTELTNKVFEVYSCEKLRGSKTFKVEQTHTRKFDLERELYYTVNKETGLPEPTDKPVIYEKPRDEQGRFISTKALGAKDIKWESFNRDYIIYHDDLPDAPYEWNLRKLFADALEGKPYRLLKLPMPRPIYDGDDRLPATYANFLIINGAVLCPTYAQSDLDAEALRLIGEAFPDREIVGIDCRSIIKQHGSLHCCTMQFPQK